MQSEIGKFVIGRIRVGLGIYWRINSFLNALQFAGDKKQNFIHPVQSIFQYLCMQIKGIKSSEDEIV